MTAVDPENPYVQQRRAIHAAITDSVTDDTELEGHILSGWVLVFETVGQDGVRGMHACSGDATGDSDLPPWTAEGWTRYVAANGYFDAEYDDET